MGVAVVSRNVEQNPAIPLLSLFPVHTILAASGNDGVAFRILFRGPLLDLTKAVLVNPATTPALKRDLGTPLGDGDHCVGITVTTNAIGSGFTKKWGILCGFGHLALLLAHPVYSEKP
jgi:hypothetical protein